MKEGTARKRTLRRWPWLLVAIAVLLSGTIYWRVSAQTPAAVQAPTATVSRGDLAITIEGSGSVQPARNVGIPFQAAGMVREVLVQAGDHVKSGQVLARLDNRELELSVHQSEANLKSAQAKLEVARHGAATPQDVTAAQANVDSAEAGLFKVRNGNATEEEIANAEAQVRSAEANLHAAKTGNVTAQDIANAEAAVRSAEAQLQKTRTGNVTPADIASAEAQVRSAEAGLEKTRTGNVTAVDISNAEAQVRSAEAQLQKVMSGATPDQLSAAQANLQQAQQSLQKTKDNASSNKSSAEQTMLQSADSVRLAQDAYSKAYWNNQQAQSGQNPATGHSFDEDKLDAGVQQRQYADALNTATLNLSQAQSRLEQAKLAYANAEQQEITDVASAQTQVDNAQVQLDELMKGPKPEDVTVAQAQVDQARGNLQKLQAGGSPADVIQAQAQLDQARANLQKLKQGGTPADIAQAQAQLDQARGNLQKLRAGGTPDTIAQAQAQLDQARGNLAQLTAPATEADIAQAQAQVDTSKANLEKLSAPAADPDIVTAEAAVTQAEAQLEAAQLTLDHATLVAPYDGVVGAVSIVPGGIVDASTAAVTLDDRSTLHIDLSMSESDVARVEVGQPVTLSFDALPEATVEGTVAAIAPTSTVTQDVVTYLVQVKFDPGTSPGTLRVKLGMTASAQVTVQKLAGVILVPSRAIQTQGRNRTVQVVYGNNELPVSVAVQVGASNGTLTEILSCVDTNSMCLKEGDKLMLSTTTTATTGATTTRGLFTGGGGGGFTGGPPR